MTEPAKIVALKRPPSDLAAHLRAMADAADRGDITDLVMCYVECEEYEFRMGTSRINAVAMATMLQSEAVRAMREVV